MIKNSTKTHALKEIVLGLSIFVACTLFLISGAVAPKDSGAQAGLPNLTGAAWSDNIGWICLDSSCGGSVDPVVEIQANGNLTGYGWSDNIGWVKFGDLTGFPSGSGTVSNNAKYDSATKEITGWARACAGTVNGDCSTMESRDDGWDGWISLSGSGYGLKVDTDNTNIVSRTGSGEPYAWGSDVVGWVNFRDVGVEGLSNDCVYNHEGQDYNISNGSSRIFLSSCVDGSRTRTNVTCVNGVATPSVSTQECVNDAGDCKLPALTGTTAKLLAVGSTTVRYASSQVRSGTVCVGYRLQCNAGAEGAASSLSSLTNLPVGVSISDLKYENCRALPGVIER